MKKYSVEIKELLSEMELYEVKAGVANRELTKEEGSCSFMCTSCMACTTCTSCTTKAMDVIIL